MQHFKRLALLVVPFVAVLGLSGVANATSTNTGESNVAGSRAAALAEAESFAAHLTVDATASVTNSVYNAWTGNLGVIHVRDGSYVVPGKYDSLLPPSEDTAGAFGWSTTAGWYNGPGRCNTLLRSDDGGNTWKSQPPVGPGQHFIGSHTSYIVSTYVC